MQLTGESLLTHIRKHTSSKSVRAAPMVVKRLLERRWIERRGVGMDTVFRLTDEGLDAKKAPIPLGR
jgi:hypothetical protein